MKLPVSEGVNKAFSSNCSQRKKTAEVDIGREGTDQDRNELLMMYDKDLQADPEKLKIARRKRSK